MEKICNECNNQFIVNEKNKREKLRLFCGGLCAKKFNGKSNKGKRHSDETKKNMSSSRMSLNNNFYGKKHTEETKKIITSKKLERDLKKIKKIELTEKEISILNGILIADGSLTQPTSISSRMTYGCKYKETLNKITEELNNLTFSNVYEYTSKPHKKTNKCYTSFFLKSISNYTLLEWRNKWYPNGIKIIPNDIKLDIWCCYWWFIGDGFLRNKCVNLCTDSFTKEDNEMIVNKFKEIGYNTIVSSRNRIVFKREDSKRFLEWIKKENYLNIYDYKWMKINE